MPIAEIETPSGRTVEIEVPQGATEQQIMAFVQANSQEIERMAMQSTAGVPGSELLSPRSRAELSPEQQRELIAARQAQQQAAGIDRPLTPTSASSAANFMQQLEVENPALAQTVKDTGAFEQFMIGAGKQVASLGRGLGLMDQATPDERQAFEALSQSSQGAVGLGEFAGAAAPFAIPGSAVARIPSAGARLGVGSALGATEGALMARGEGQDPLKGAAIGGIAGGLFSMLPSGAVNMMDSTTQPSLTRAQIGFNAQDLSSARVDRALQREVTAGNLPVPFEGESALTKGQVTRNFEQLQFEREAAKLADLGDPLRERMANQSETLMMNLDALSDASGPVRTELRDIGQAVDSALMSRQKRLKSKVDRLYDQARQAGELESSINLDAVPDMLEDIQRFEGVAPNAGAIRKEALRLGVVDEDLNPLPVTLENAELFRSFVNSATDITNPQQARIRRIAISAVDDSTENAGGDIFKRARRARAEMARELENVGLTKRLLSTKKGTDERAIAYEDVFKKVILDSPVEEINKLRGTLLRAGDEGKQAWADLKAQGVEYIKNNALSLSQMDHRGNPIFSPDKFNRVIKSLDEKGKLDKIYGKRNAQVIRDLGDLSKDIFTAPPGSVNHSNTASALQVALDSLGSFTVTGVPAPIASALREGTRFVKNSRKKKQIRESLDYLNRQE